MYSSYYSRLTWMPGLRPWFRPPPPTSTSWQTLMYIKLPMYDNSYYSRLTWMPGLRPWVRPPPPTSTSWRTRRRAWRPSIRPARPSPALRAPSSTWRGGEWAAAAEMLSGSRRQRQGRMLSAAISGSSRISMTSGMPRSKGNNNKISRTLFYNSVPLILNFLVPSTYLWDILVIRVFSVYDIDAGRFILSPPWIP
jgi:hypothetical protein